MNTNLILRQKKYLLVAIILTINIVSVSAQSQFESAEQFELSWYNFEKAGELMKLEPGDWVADIGSRNGFYLKHLLNLVGDSGHIFAVDVDSDGLQGLHHNLSEWQQYNVSPIYSIETNPLLPANAFNAVFIRNAYHEFSEPTEMLLHVKRSLKSDGRVIISDSMQENHKNRTREEQEERHVLDINYANHDLIEAGFKIIEEFHEFSSPPNAHFYYWLIVAKPLKD